MDNLLQYIHSLTDFSADSWQLLQPALSKIQLNKNEPLLREGEVCNALYYINKGYCKSYYDLEGVAKNTGFFFENDIVTNLKSFGSGEKSAFSIAACEPLSAVRFDKAKLFEAAGQSHEIETLGRHCLRLFASKQEEFSTLFNLYSAEERLTYVEQKHPHLLQRVSLSQLASFLGVARETLSRIRKRRAQQ